MNRKYASVASNLFFLSLPFYFVERISQGKLDYGFDEKIAACFLKLLQFQSLVSLFCEETR